MIGLIYFLCKFPQLALTKLCTGFKEPAVEICALTKDDQPEAVGKPKKVAQCDFEMTKEITSLIRDIPGHTIENGQKLTNISALVHKAISLNRLAFGNAAVLREAASKNAQLVLIDNSYIPHQEQLISICRSNLVSYFVVSYRNG